MKIEALTVALAAAKLTPTQLAEAEQTARLVDDGLADYTELARYIVVLEARICELEGDLESARSAQDRRA